MKDIPGYKNRYAITEDGRIWSYTKGSKYTPSHKGLWLKPVLDEDGYFFVGLYGDEKRENARIHRMVAKTFIPNPQSKPCINHKDGDKLNNNVSNLEWCTVSENCQHAWDIGLSHTSDKSRATSAATMLAWSHSPKGKRHSIALGQSRRKLNAIQIAEILHKHQNGQSAYSLAKEYPVSKPTILKIVHHKTYKEVINELL